MNGLVLGNVIGLIGSGVMILTGLVKTKRQILIWQNVQFALMTVSNLILGAATGAVSNLLSIIRNFVCLKTEFTLPLKLLFLTVQGGLTVMLNRAGAVGWIPFIAVVLYNFVLSSKSEVRIKLVIVVCQAMWAFYDLYFRNYTTCAFDVFTMISNLAGIWMIRREAGKAGRAE